jgi:hypothetical protein
MIILSYCLPQSSFLIPSERRKQIIANFKFYKNAWQLASQPKNLPGPSMEPRENGINAGSHTNQSTGDRKFQLTNPTVKRSTHHLAIVFFVFTIPGRNSISSPAECSLAWSCGETSVQHGIHANL